MVSEIKRPVMLSDAALKALLRLTRWAHQTTIDYGDEQIALMDLQKMVEEAIENTEPVHCPCCDTIITQPARVFEDGKVVSSIKKIYMLMEQDIVDTATRYGVQLTEDQIEDVARYVDKGYDPVGNWETVIEMALDEIGIELKEVDDGKD